MIVIHKVLLTITLPPKFSPNWLVGVGLVLLQPAIELAGEEVVG